MQPTPPPLPTDLPQGLKNDFRSKALHYFETHELKLSIAFFLGGFVFDVMTLSEIDDPLTILQQLFYLFIVGGIIYAEFVREAVPGAFRFPKWLEKVWDFRSFIMHFLLGSLFSIYSLFFLKSASIFSSVVFVGLLMGVMVANELKTVQGSGLDIKISLFVICLFCFFSLLVPVLLGHVGMIPFLISFALTIASVSLIYKGLHKKITSAELHKRLTIPGIATATLFLLLYFVGWIPPVPLAAVKMGVYHRIEKARNAYAVVEERPFWNFLVPRSYFIRSIENSEGATATLGEGLTREPINDKYVLYHEKPWWRFWKNGDQHFVARAGDKIHFFVAIFSPGGFNDSIFVRWQFHDAKRGWQGSDRIPVSITGGRKEGFRGFTTKANFDYGDGDWRISVETNDGREIGRMYFDVVKDESALEERKFNLETY